MLSLKNQFVLKVVASILIIGAFLIYLLSSFGTIIGYQMLFYYEGYFNILGLLSIILAVSSMAMLYFKKQSLIDLALFLGIMSLVLLLIIPSSLMHVIDGDVNNPPLGVGYYLALSFYLLALLLVANVALNLKRFTIKDISELAILVALAVILDFVKIRLLPNGGSISLEMLPLFLIALRHSFIKTFIACGLIYGFISSSISGYGLAYYPFDYLLAFGAIAVLSLFRHLVSRNNRGTYRLSSMCWLALGVILAVLLRFIAATISGMIYWETGFIDSMLYNTPSLASGALCVVVLLVAFPLLIKINRRFKSDDLVTLENKN
ncbi:MAG: energy-coupled thiamine transporter ThiT [Erysipelotrichaceae bacterium]|jgi:thiamine transporter|nr:energy-coupled thiamine transporter ThiT [Erysipelotrichaceae bacterium]